jgi:predicted DNA-binding WGR domain protein
MATTTEVSNNLIAHFHDENINSDKVYIACVKRNSSGSWDVIGRWGRRGGGMQEDIKTTCSTRETALEKAQKLFYSKTKKGYINIESPSYQGPVTRDSVRPHLVPEQIDNEAGAKMAVEKKKRLDRLASEFEVVCLNPTGIEKQFDKGERYMAKTDEKDESMLQVFDIYGKWQRVLAARFEAVTE